MTIAARLDTTTLDNLMRTSPTTRARLLAAAGMMGGRALLATHGPMTTVAERAARMEAAALCDKHCAATGILFDELYAAAVERIEAALFADLMLGD